MKSRRSRNVLWKAEICTQKWETSTGVSAHKRFPAIGSSEGKADTETYNEFLFSGFSYSTTTTTKPQTTTPNTGKPVFLFINTQLSGIFSNVCQNLPVNKEKQLYMFLTTLQCVSLSLYNSPNEMYKRKFQLYVAAESKTWTRWVT